VRERRKEPREGSEIDPETACIQTVGAPAQWAFGSFGERSEPKDSSSEMRRVVGERSVAKRTKDEIEPEKGFSRLG